MLGLIALGGLGFGWNASSKLDSTQQSVANQLKAEQQSVQQDVSALRDRLAQDEKANADLQGDLKVVTDKLKLTQGQLKKAREESAKKNDETSEKLTAPGHFRQRRTGYQGYCRRRENRGHQSGCSQVGPRRDA